MALYLPNQFICSTAGEDGACSTDGLAGWPVDWIGTTRSLFWGGGGNAFLGDVMVNIPSEDRLETTSFDSWPAKKMWVKNG